MSQKYYASYDEWAADFIENGEIKDGTSYADQRIGAYLQNQKNQLSAYESKMQGERDKAISDADILNQRLQRYLPQQLAAQGLYGTGISEDSYLKLQKQYNDSVSTANNTYSQGMSDYQLAMNSQIFDKVDTIRKEGEAEMKAAYEEALVGLEGQFNNAQEIQNYVQSYKGKLSENDYNNLVNEGALLIRSLNYDASNVDGKLGEAIANTPKLYSVTATNSQDFKVDNSVLGDGDNFEITFDGVTYLVQANTNVSQDVKDISKDIGNGTIFKHGDKYYYKNNKGKVVRIEKRFTHDANANTGWSEGQNFHSFKEAFDIKNNLAGEPKLAKGKDDLTIGTGGRTNTATFLFNDGSLPANIYLNKNVSTTVKNKLIEKGTDGIYVYGEGIYYKSGGNVYRITAQESGSSEFKAFEQQIFGLIN